MRIPPIVCGAALCLAGCIVPPSLYERAIWAPEPETWQERGRYRPGEVPPAAQAVPAPAPAPTQAMERAAPTYITSTDPHAELPAAPAPAPTQASEPPLYAWDGGVVDGAPQGRVAQEEGTPRGLETPPAGRAHIIELYQQVLDERDALASEVEILRKALEETRTALDGKTREAQGLADQVATLEAARTGLMTDNRDLAARLVQAQIRRLEAEKLLLETRIEIERAKSEEAALAAAQARGGASRPPAGKTSPAERGGNEE
jgi:hypothetical protein